MQRSAVSKAFSNVRILRGAAPSAAVSRSMKQYDVFINHRGTDTKRTISGLLFQHLSSLGLDPFLDSKTMRPGDRLFDTIDPAVRGCRVGVAVFSPRYCESYFCLHELALMMEHKKKVVPIFCDVKPSELQIKDTWNCSTKDLERFHRALEEAKYTVGLTFDTCTGDWAEFLTSAKDIIIQRLLEVEENQHNLIKPKITKFSDADFVKRYS